MISQSVSSNKASGWTVEESLTKTIPLDLTAVKKVNQRLGNSSFPLELKKKEIYMYVNLQYMCTHAVNKMNK